MATGLSDLIPGLRDAEDQYRLENAEAFAGIEPAICGTVQINPFTPQMFLELDGAKNAFFAPAGTLITAGDVCALLWRCSPYYTRQGPGADDLRRFYQANLYTLEYRRAVDEINDYIRRSWSGMPLWRSNGRAEAGLGQWPARLVHMFAREYGWLEGYVLNLPFRRLWQYANRILEEHDPKYKERCAAALNSRLEWLREYQAKLDQEKPAGGRN